MGRTKTKGKDGSLLKSNLPNCTNKTANKTKIKPKKSSKSSTLTKRKLTTIDPKPKEASSTKASSSKNNKPKKKKRKKEKKFDYKLPIIVGIPNHELVTKRMPWFRAEHKSRCTNRRKCSDDWSHCGFDHYDENTNHNDDEYLIHPLSKEALTTLDEEIYSFCAYVRLTQPEIQVRENIQNMVLNLCNDLFATNNDDTNSNDNENSHNGINAKKSTKDIQVTKFGSFTALEVCTFASDVDLALWGILEHDEDFKMEQEKLNRKKRKTEAVEKKPNQNQIKSQRNIEKAQKVQKWINAIQEAEEKKGAEEETEAEAEKKGIEMNLKATKHITESTEKAPDALVSVTKNKSKSNESDSDNDSDTDYSTKMIDDNEYDSEEDDADKMESFNKPCTSGLSKTTKILPPPSPSPSDIWPSDSDSDTYNSVEASDDDKNNDIEVSCFVQHVSKASSEQDTQNTNDSNKTSSSSKSSKDNKQLPISVPRGKIRDLIVRDLKRLGRKLRKTGIITALTVRSNARVPIINLATNLGVECDIAFGGQNGTDTSKFASSCIQFHEAFAPVVVLLKILLRQTDLDKPFTGGLGSYKLYVLVFFHLKKHLALGGSNRPSDVFLSFLFRFGGIQTAYDGPFSKIITELSQNMVISSDNDGMADLSPIFKIENCKKAFGLFYKRLLSQYEKYQKNSDKVSFLASIIDHKILHRDREMYFQKARRSRLFHFNKKPKTQLFSNQNNFASKSKPRANGIKQQRPIIENRAKQQSKEVYNKKTKIVEDEKTNEEKEAAKLMAGYNMKKGSNGELIRLNEDEHPFQMMTRSKIKNKK